jgi:hypothetical protein
MLLAREAKKASVGRPYLPDMARHARHHCERCARPVVAVRPHWGWRAASIVAVAFFVALSFAAGASGLLLFGAGVVVFALGACVLGPLNERASEPPRCPDCRCVVVPLARLPAARAEIEPSRRHLAA